MTPLSLTFRVRMTAWYLAVMSSLFVLALAGMYVGMRETMLRNIDKDLAQRAEEMTHYLWRHHDLRGRHDSPMTWEDAFYRASGVQPSEELYQLQDDTGFWLYQSPAMKALEIPGANPDLGSPTHIMSLSRGEHHLRVLTRSVVVAQKTYVFQFASYIDPSLAVLDRFRTISVITLVLLLLTASLSGYWLSGRAIAPIAKITTTAQRLSERNLSERIPLPRVHDELHELTRVLNETFARLEASFRRVRQFTADASHELRTPVTVIRTTAEVAMEHQRDSTEYNDMMRIILQESETVSELIERLLTMARTDSGATQAPLAAASIADVMGDIRDPAKAMAANADLLLTITVTHDQTQVLTHGPTLKRLLLILIENACQYTRAGGSIHIRTSHTAEHVILEIRDTGIGIKEEDLPRLFERFFRGENARQFRAGGSGLGLAIAQSLTEPLRAVITIESTLGRGTSIRLRLNRASAPSEPSEPADSAFTAGATPSRA